MRNHWIPACCSLAISIRGASLRANAAGPHYWPRHRFYQRRGCPQTRGHRIENIDNGEKTDSDYGIMPATTSRPEFACPAITRSPSRRRISRPYSARISDSEVATDVRIDVILSPGAASEIVQVTAEQPLVETVNDTLGGTVTNKAINELPLQGRDFQNLLDFAREYSAAGGGLHSTPPTATGRTTTITLSMERTITIPTTVRPSLTTPESRAHRPVTYHSMQSRNSIPRRTKEPITDGSPEWSSTSD